MEKEEKQKVYIIIKPKKMEEKELKIHEKKMEEKEREGQEKEERREEAVQPSIMEIVKPIEISIKDKYIEEVKKEEVEEEEMKKISMNYPLITIDNKVFASAHIFWDPNIHEVVYFVKEPSISEEDKKLLRKIETFIQEKINVDFNKLRKSDAINYLTKLFDEALEYFKKGRMDKNLKDILKYYIFRDFIGMERIEPLLKDPYIEDISCDGVGIPIYVYHKDPRIGSIKTNILFENRETLNSFVMRLAERCGKIISIASPLLDGSLPDGSRVQATLESDIARRGSNFTIRKFSEKPLTPIDLLRFGTCDINTLSYLWFAIEHGSSILISGGTASGKTTLLNVLSLFIKPQMKIVSIEDTAELQLYHPHWVPHVARVSIAKEEREIDLYELLRESLRQRPDYIIVGEVRGREAYVLFQQIALGHAGLATIHAESFSKLVDRLTTPPISLPPSLIQNLDLVIFVARVRMKEKYARRIISIAEVIGFDKETNTPKINEVMRWDPFQDKFIINKSYLIGKIALKSGLKEDEIKKDLKDRAKFLYFLVKRGVNDYKEITKMLTMFYSYREIVMEKINAIL
jgi:flagellar protein FlaI